MTAQYSCDFTDSAQTPCCNLKIAADGGGGGGAVR